MTAPPLCDFTNSYMTFTVPKKENTARIQIDAIARISGDGANDGEFVLITPCKSEFMYRESGLFQDPNFDFCGIFSRSEFQILRTFATHDPKRAIEVDAGDHAPRFESVKIDLRYFPKTEPLTTDAAVVKATLANRHILARTSFKDAAGKRSAVIEYPVKTMNVAEPTQRFQTDTGPIIVPRWIDPGAAPAKGNRPIEQFIMAFVCSNRFTGGDLVLRQPTKTDGPTVMHYSRLLPIPEARHEFFAV